MSDSSRSSPNSDIPTLKWYQLVAKAVSRFTQVLASLLVLGTLLSFIARVHWTFELHSNFRLQYGMLLAAASIVMLVIRQLRFAGVCGGLAVINLAIVGGIFWPVAVPDGLVADDGEGGQTEWATVRVCCANVLTGNQQHDMAIQKLEKLEADVLVLPEINGHWSRSLEAIHDKYPFRLVRPQNDNFGLACFSKFPIVSELVHEVGDLGFLMLEIELSLESGRTVVIAAHPPPPVNSLMARERLTYLRKIASVARQHESVVVLGDLNLTPYSPYFSDLCEVANLRDSRQGHGIQGSWPVHASPLRIPIDHCLLKGQKFVLDRSIGPDIGSDHLPVSVDLAIAVH